MSGPREPGPGDLPLPDMPSPQPELGPIDVTGKMTCSLSHALTEEFTGIKPFEYTEITPEMIELAQPKNLGRYLIDVPKGPDVNPCALPYFDARLGRDRFIALPPQEAKVVPFSIAGLGGAAGRRAAGKMPSSWLSSGERSRERQTQAQAMEGKMPSMLTYRKMLEDNRELLSKFVTASKEDNWGKSFFGSEATIRESLNYLQTFLIDESLVAAYAHQRNRTPSQARLLSRTITHNLFISPDKKDYFHDMVVFLREYNGRKLDVVDQRINFVQRNIGKPLVAKAT